MENDMENDDQWWLSLFWGVINDGQLVVSKPRQ